MSEIINLRQVRKRAERVAAAKRAESNRIAHGLSKSEKIMAKALKAKAERELEGHRIPGDDRPDEKDGR